GRGADLGDRLGGDRLGDREELAGVGLVRGGGGGGGLRVRRGDDDRPRHAGPDAPQDRDQGGQTQATPGGRTPSHGSAPAASPAPGGRRAGGRGAGGGGAAPPLPGAGAGGAGEDAGRPPRLHRL